MNYGNERWKVKVSSLIGIRAWQWIYYSSFLTTKITGSVITGKLHLKLAGRKLQSLSAYNLQCCLGEAASFFWRERAVGLYRRQRHISASSCLGSTFPQLIAVERHVWTGGEGLPCYKWISATSHCIKQRMLTVLICTKTENATAISSKTCEIPVQGSLHV